MGITMKTKTRALLVLTTLFVLLVLAPSRAHANQSGEETPQEDAVLCPPGAYVNIHTDCQPSGPSQYLTELGEHGFSFPVEPFPGISPDVNLTYVDYKYAQLREYTTPVYPSAESAAEGRDKDAARTMTAAFSYVSYTQEPVVNGARVYEIEPNAWMSSGDVIRVTPPRFQGYRIQRTPTRPFGWVLSYLSASTRVEAKRTPGLDVEDYTGHYLDNHQIVWIYDTVQASDGDWYMVGPDEWLPDNVVARVIPDTTPPEGVEGGRWIEVNLYEQTLAVYDDYEMVFATLVASGLDPFWTKPGLFQIYETHDATDMDGAFELDSSDAYYLEDVPWTMYFDNARALHGAYWRANLGFPQSHGCVNLSVGDARWIYDWADIGDWVYVWDPSGQTPTDPAVYNED